MRAPKYGFPAHKELAADDAPCRHCLRTFRPGTDQRILFAYDRFAGVNATCRNPARFISTRLTARTIPPTPASPKTLAHSPRTLEAYARGRHLIAREIVSDGKFEPAIDRLFTAPGRRLRPR